MELMKTERDGDGMLEGEICITCVSRAPVQNDRRFGALYQHLDNTVNLSSSLKQP